MPVVTRNEKGSIMLSVIIVFAILIILAAALMDSSTMSFGISKHEEASDRAYFAAQSGIEKCFSFMDNLCSDRDYSKDIDYEGNVDEFAKRVISDKIFPDLKIYTSGTPTGNAVFKISLSDTTEDSANVEITGISFLSWKPSTDGEPGKIDVTVGVTAAADYMSNSNKAVNKTVFAKKEIAMYIPKGFSLNAAIYTIGDLMVDNINAQVEGDIVAYGTSPQYAKQVEQYYYGGIYAKNNGHLSVHGNAYSRGLIRTGEYSSSPDNSSIYVYKDAVANGIHIFGKGDRIVVGRNAYTFDDLELNGEDSVIAINGSFLGLSSEDAYHHDQSSGIVNSAIVHYAGSDASLKSRIIINGDVVVGGGTFKIDPDTGNVDDKLPQIEDASVIAAKSNYWPMYKEYINGIQAGTITESKFHTWLYNNKDSAAGFSNLIQCWKPRVFSDDTGIGNWLSLIDQTRGIGSNNASYFDAGTDTNTISGFCHYELGANDRVYFMNKGISQITMLKFLNSGFAIDNIRGEASKTDWNNFWHSLNETVPVWSDLATTDDPISDKLSYLKDLLLRNTQVFANREYIYDDTADSPIKNTLNSAPKTSDNLFQYLRDQLNTKFPVSEDNPYVLNFSTESPNKNINVCSILADRIAKKPLLADKYFLVINPEPSITLEIDGKVNGIIFSMGKVVLKNGAGVNGAIIAAGSGFTPDGSKNYVLQDKSSADQIKDPTTKIVTNYLPQILKEGDNLDKLDDGSYAGVHFKGTTTGTAATVTFPGKAFLLGTFKEQQDMDLYSIFDSDY